MVRLIRNYFARYPERIGPRERRLLLDLEEHEAYHRSPMFTKSQLGLFGDPTAPGSRGGLYYRTKTGRVRYAPHRPGPPPAHVPADRPPLVVSYGAGVDSTATLVEMHNRGIRPDLILFADTGGEKPETYAYLPIMQRWLESVGFPQIVVVRYVPPRAPYKDLEGNCEANETLPSLAMGMHSCSLKWKVEPQHQYLNQWQPAQDAWARGAMVSRAIGYDDSVADHKRAERMSKVTMAIGLDDSAADHKRSEKASKTYASGKDDDKYAYWYPLQEWGIDREEAKRRIAAAGLPVPEKSACFYCPASKKHEIEWLADTHPDLARRAIAMEERARTGKHGFKTIKGLGRNFSWKEHLEERARRLREARTA